MIILGAMAWRWSTVAGAGSQRDVGVGSVFRIMIGVAGGIVLAMVLLLLVVAALASLTPSSATPSHRSA